MAVNNHQRAVRAWSANEGRGSGPSATARPRPVFVLEDHLYYLFTQIVGRRNRHITQKLRPFGVSVPKWRVLAVLYARPGAAMTELADLTTIDRTTLTRTVDRMARHGLVGRRADSRDRRRVRLYLRGAGRSTFARALPPVLEQNVRSTRGIPARALAQFRRTLSRIIRNLDADQDASRGGPRRARRAQVRKKAPRRNGVRRRRNAVAEQPEQANSDGGGEPA